MAKLLSVALAAALLGVPMTAAAQQQPPRAERHEKAKKDQKEKMGKVLGALHHINQVEIADAQMALENSQNPQVQQYARMVMQDHQRLDRQVQQLAQKERIPLMEPSDPTAQALRKAHDQQKQSMQQMEGMQFDSMWVSSQPFMHRFGLAMIDNGRQMAGGNAQMMQLLVQAQQSMQRHLEESERLMQRQMDVAQQPMEPRGG